MGKPVVGYRTESRSPYGALTDFSNGMHFFMYMICDSFVTVPQTSISSMKDLDDFTTLVANDLHEAVAIAE
jgi:hypothetical protein